MRRSGSKRDGLGSAFSALLAATCVTNLGDGLRFAALPLLATTLTSSPFLIGSITAAQFLPWATFAPFGGVIVDRSDRRRLILVTQAWRGCLVAGLCVVVLADLASIWHLFVVAFLLTVGEILVDPSVVAIVPTLVERSDLDRANSRISTVEVVTNDFLGAPLGVLTFALAPWLPFLFDSMSYLGSIAPFRRLPATGPRGDTASLSPPRQPVRVEMGEGLRWILSHQFLRPWTFGVAVFHLGTAGAFSLLVLLVTDVLKSSDAMFGVVLAAAAVGASMATLVAAPLADRFSRRRLVPGAAAVTGFTVVAAGIVGSGWHLIPIWALNGAASGVSLAIGRGFIQRHTPNDRLGRTAIASRMITRTSFVVGALLAGTIATTTSVRWSFVVAGVFHLLGAMMQWRAFRHG